jgi:hypothetical protein
LNKLESSFASSLVDTLQGFQGLEDDLSELRRTQMRLMELIFR